MAIRHKRPNYLHWIKLNEPAVDELKLQKTCLFPYQPQISIVTTNSEISQKYYKKFLSSIQKQTYNKWKLCIADTGNSKNTNEEIKLNADGEYIVFIDNNKTLAPFALYEIVKYINEAPDVEILYSDEDSIVYGKRRNPVFKPDYAPDTLRSWNYIGHFVVMKRNLVDCLGWLKSEYGEIQDYDFVLRASEATKKIHHIRKILCHNRRKKALSRKSSAAQVILSHIERLGLKGTVKPVENHPGHFNVIYDVIGNPSVSIIIPNKDYMTTLKTCVDSILERSTYANYEIVIIENNSENEETFTYYRKLEKQAKIRVLYYPEKGFNYSKLINFGVKNCSSDYIVQLNNDTEVITPNWLELMLGFAQRPDVGAVGVKLLFPNGYIQHAGIGGSFSEGLFHILSGNYIMNYTAVTGACLMSRTKLYNEVGYMDEEFPFDFGDVDFCFKLRAEGLLIVYNPLAELYHHESLTRGFHDTPEKLALSMKYRDVFFKRWSDKICIDPYSNPYYRFRQNL